MGQSIGKLNNGGKCPPDREKVDGMCYKRCPAGMEHTPGMPYLCKTAGDLSYPRGAGKPMKCPPGLSEDSLGLCYRDPPPGFVKTTLGMMSDVCPPGSTDFGVGCTRNSYTRNGNIALKFELRHLKPELR